MLGDVRLADLPRRRPCAAGSSSARPTRCSSPGTLRRELDPWGRANGDDARSSTAVAVANAEDVLEALPEGLDATVDERGRSFSGGQRQRLVLARALLSDAELLVLVEPTSAVDAHTEARIARPAARGARRHGRPSIVTTSPLVLDQADRVVLVEDGRVVAEGTHRELLRDERRLPRDVVTRGEDAVSDLLPIADGRRAARCRRAARAPPPRGADRRRRSCTRSPRPPASPARRCSAGSSRRSRTARRPRTSTRLVLVLAAFLVAQTVLTWFARRASFVLSEKMFAELREDFMRRVLALPLSTVERAGTGDLVSRTTADVDALARTVRFASPRDADRRRHDGPDRRRGGLGQPARRAAVHRRRAGARRSARAGTCSARAGRLPLGARGVRDARRHRRRDGRRRPHGRGARPATRSACGRIDADLDEAVPRRAAHALPAHGLVPDGRVRLRAARSPPRSPGAAGSSPAATPRSAR